MHFNRTTHLDRGGVVRSVLDTSLLLTQAGVRVTLATLDDRDAPAEWRNEDPALPDVVRLDRDTVFLGRLSRKDQRRVSDQVAQVDVLHLHGLWVPANLQLAAISRRVGTPYVITAHGMLSPWSMAQKKWKKRIGMWTGVRRYLDHADAVLFCCEEESDRARPWVTPRDPRIVPLAVDHHMLELKPQPPEPGPSLRVAFLGRLVPVKGIDRLINAAAILRDRGVDVRFDIAGSGSHEGVYRDLAEEHGVADRVRFVGFVDSAGKTSLFRDADVVALPSRHENFGLAWAEGMAAGRTAIVTRGVGPWREIEMAGGIIAGDEPDDLADAIESLAQNRDALAERGERARDWVHQNLSPASIARQLIRIYNDVARQTA